MSRIALVALLAGLAGLPSPSLAGGPRDPYRLVVVTRPAPYWGYYYSPYAAALHGLADYTRAEGQYLLMRESARQQREVTRQKKLETRQKELEHIKWERDFIWNMRREEERKIIAYEAERAKNMPTMTEILSGGMLNILQRELSKNSRSPDSPSRPIKEEWLENINFTATGGNTGLLRQKEISWPVILQDERLASTRAAIETHLETARREAGKGKVSGKTIEELLDLRNKLDEEATALLKASRSFGIRHHIQASRFTRDLNQALLLLENPKEAAFLLGAKPAAKTVAELMQYMRENGLTFGAASAGSERHYISLHAEMAEEARQLEQRPNPEK
jgi:hypothetical protein